VVDRTLNYGREIVARFVEKVDTHLALDLGPGLGGTSRPCVEPIRRLG
jgi:hypothetical protein